MSMLTAADELQVVVQRWLIHNRVRIDASVRAASAAESIENLAEELRMCGLPVRALELEPADIACLDIGALVLLVSGEPAILIKRERGCLVLELAKGTRVARVATARGVVGTRALVLAPPETSERFALLVWGTLSDKGRVGMILQVAALSVLLAVLGAAGPVGVSIVVKDVAPGQESGLLVLVAGALVIISLHRAALGVIRDWGVAALEASLKVAALPWSLTAALSQPLTIAAQRGMSKELQRMRSTEQAIELTVSRLAVPVIDGLVGLAMAGLMLLEVPRFGVVLTVAGSLMMAVGALYGRAVRALDRPLLEAGGAQRHSLYELIASVQWLKPIGQERFGLVRWMDHLLRERSLQFTRGLQMARMNRILLLLERAVFWCVVALGARACLRGELDVSGLMVCILATSSFGSAVQALAFLPIHAGRVRTHVDIVDSLTSRELPAARARGAPTRPRAEKAIVVERVWFRYGKDTPWVLHDLSLSVSWDEIVHVAYASGRGKTTLLRLITGLMRPDHGRISVAGLEPTQARRLVHYVPQSSELMACSVLENLRVFSGGASYDCVISAAEKTGLLEIVNAWPMRLHTRLAARGSNISGGQRQMILLTAALASDKPILLLDEAFSHLDAALCTRFTSGKIWSSKTGIFVGHESALVTTRER